jgi:ribonuclease HII
MQARLAGEAVAAGVDEAGRGPLAGPVVAAAVILESGRRWDGVDDSKKVPPEVRAEVFARVREGARAFSWSVIGPRAIDHFNIRGASLEAMRRAVRRLRVCPDLVLVDGRDPVPGIGCRQEAIIDGDAKVLAIAAASILAKVVRDRIMERLDRVWPQYGFARHKGYATPEHLEALERLGPCPLHRYSFTPVCVLELPLDV